MPSQVSFPYIINKGCCNPMFWFCRHVRICSVFTDGLMPVPQAGICMRRLMLGLQSSSEMYEVAREIRSREGPTYSRRYTSCVDVLHAVVMKPCYRCCHLAQDLARAASVPAAMRCQVLSSFRSVAPPKTRSNSRSPRVFLDVIVYNVVPVQCIE